MHAALEISKVLFCLHIWSTLETFDVFTIAPKIKIDYEYVNQGISRFID